MLLSYFSTRCFGHSFMVNVRWDRKFTCSSGDYQKDIRHYTLHNKDKVLRPVLRDQ